MPNIVLIGRSSLEICDKISKIVTGLGVKETEGVITFNPGTLCLDMTKRHSDAPYLIVRDTSVDRAMKIAKALNKELNIEIEVESIYAFLPRKGMRFKKRKRKPEKRTMCIDGINKCIPRGAECAGCGG